MNTHLVMTHDALVHELCRTRVFRSDVWFPRPGTKRDVHEVFPRRALAKWVEEPTVS